MNIVLPVKDPEGAKSRLSAVLSPAERTEMALHLFRNTLEVLSSVNGNPHILVVTDSEKIRKIARDYPVDVLIEERAEGETRAVERATQYSLREGFREQVVLPGDMPFIDREDIETLLSRKMPSPGIILCPAVNDDGTNAMRVSPPDVIQYRFGDRSFDGYQCQAKKKNIPCEVLRLPGFVLDTDTPEDLRACITMETPGFLKEIFSLWGVQERFFVEPEA